MDGLGYNRPDFLPQLSIFDPTKINIAPNDGPEAGYGDASRVISSIGNTWLSITSQLSMWKFLPRLFQSLFVGYEQVPIVFDEIWAAADLHLWSAARRLDRLGKPGPVARAFGLIDPSDPNRPTSMMHLLRDLDPSKSEAATTPAPMPPSRIEAIPVSGPTESAVRSGHAFVAENMELRPKEKPKTRGVVVSDVSNAGDVTVREDDEFRSLPQMLPPQFKMGKKILRVIYHHIVLWLFNAHRHI